MSPPLRVKLALLVDLFQSSTNMSLTSLGSLGLQLALPATIIKLLHGLGSNSTQKQSIEVMASCIYVAQYLHFWDNGWHQFSHPPSIDVMARTYLGIHAETMGDIHAHSPTGNMPLGNTYSMRTGTSTDAPWPSLCTPLLEPCYTILVRSWNLKGNPQKLGNEWWHCPSRSYMWVTFVPRECGTSLQLTTLHILWLVKGQPHSMSNKQSVSIPTDETKKNKKKNKT